MRKRSVVITGQPRLIGQDVARNPSASTASKPSDIIENWIDRTWYGSLNDFPQITLWSHPNDKDCES